MDKMEGGYFDRNSEKALESEKLILPHEKAMYVRALQLCKDPDAAEDLVQDTFFLGIKYINQLKEKSKSKGWLSIILKNQFFKECSRNKKWEIWDYEDLANNFVDENLPEKEFLEEEGDRSLKNLVESLEEYLKTPLKMFHFQNLPYREISLRLNIPIGTVMSRISRARGRLKDKLVEERGWLN